MIELLLIYTAFQLVTGAAAIAVGIGLCKLYEKWSAKHEA